MDESNDVTKAVPFPTIGRFRIVRSLGRGGMGEVYLADDPQLGRSVALKVLGVDVADDPDRRAFFRREASSAAVAGPAAVSSVAHKAIARGAAVHRS